jgi:MFS family permease
MSTQAVEKKGVHYSFAILAGCCCCGAAGIMALVVSMMSVYLVPVSEALGMTRPEFTLWNATMGFVQIVTLPIWGQFIAKNVRICFLIGVLAEVIGILLFIVVTNTIGMIIAGIFIGIAMPMTFKLIIPTLINNWFAPKHRGKYMGIAMAFSGIGTFVWAPMFTAIILAFGYKTSYVINAILAAVLLLPWVFVFKYKPEDKGLKPYGAVAGEENARDVKTTIGMSASKAFRQPVFYALFIAVGITAIGNGFNNNMRPMAADMLANTDLAASAAMIAATMVSTCAVGNLLGKILYGFIVDKVGLKSGTILFLCTFFLCFVVWMFFPGQIIMMYVGAFLLGTHNGLASVAMPLVTRGVFGSRDYAKIYSRITIAQAIAGGFSTTVLTGLALAIGTNMGPIYTGFGMVVVIIIAITLLYGISKMGKLEWTDESTEATPQAS